MRDFPKLLTLAFVMLLSAGSASGTECVVRELRESLVRNLAPRVSLESLTSQIASRRARVPEFNFIRNEAEKRGLRVWLFGGTAAGYGHYVKWDLLREAGDLRFQRDRFDYDYTNIYRSTQDLDIVVDGSAQQAQEFQQALQAQFPYFLGSKTTPWEVRSLRESSGDKGSILDDFGFMNQHTDSNSTGMIELTNPPRGESIVRDVRDWRNPVNSQFLKDLHEDKLTYYFSPTHGQTERAREGKNPPIFSVVRALTKAFQYDLKIRPEDMAVMKREIDQFNPTQDLASEDAQRWLEKNGKKLYQHAVDIEYASETLDQLGLKRKLIGIKNNPNQQDSLAFWMNKEPLKSKPVGQGTGKTAKELGLTEVAHETGNFLAYESITRAHTGEPNVFVSRKGAAGENAIYGDGFYTAVGTRGARGTGMTIRFEVDPNAREGTDFTKAGNYVLWRNKNAIRVIPESIEMSPTQYFELLAGGNSISADDQALLWKLKRKLEHTLAAGLADPAELKKIREIVLENVKERTPRHGLLFEEWIKLEAARRGIPPQDLPGLINPVKTQRFAADPASFVENLTQFAHGTEMSGWMRDEFIPALLKNLKLDLGERAIENCLASPDASVRSFGLHALKYVEEKNPSPRIAHLKWLFLRSPDQPIDRREAAEWLKADLQQHSALAVFERPVRDNPAALALFKKARAESFQFQRFETPPEGRKFKIGSPESEFGRWPGEDLREVVLTKSFEMQSTPVTQLQWFAIMGENPAQFFEGGDVVRGITLHPNRPVERVSWNDVQKFLEKLNALDPHSAYRLPTEAEWEVAARAGTETAYSYGSNSAELPQYAWFNINSDGQTHDVASLKPNPRGLYDMHGNVLEWVQDAYRAKPPTGIDPLAPPGPNHAVRGGSFVEAAEGQRTAYRQGYAPDVRYYAFGFRLVRTPKEKN